MKRNKIFSRFIVVTLTAALLLITGSRAIPVSALAVGPLADPVYDTEIIAFKEYVEQNLDAPQLDIMFFLIGGLTVAQLGAQDAMLVSPYPNEENVKEWLINCGIQLYNSVIGLVPSGDYYMGIPSIGSAATQGVPREVLKALVAQMMGDAVVAINYPDLDTFLEENPDKIFLPFNRDLQLGVNAIFGLNGGNYNWQFRPAEWFDYTYTWKQPQVTGVALREYQQAVSEMANPIPCYVNGSAASSYNGYVIDSPFLTNYDFFINTNSHTCGFVNSNGSTQLQLSAQFFSGYETYATSLGNITLTAESKSYNPNNFDTYTAIAKYYLNHCDSYSTTTWFQSRADGNYNNVWCYPFPVDYFTGNVYVGSSWESRQLIEAVDDLNLQFDQTQYYQQVTNDYLFDLRGLMGDLVNYVYLNPIWDNIYDLVGNLVVPDRVKVSVDLTPITNLLAPPVPVNMNDIAELTDNTYLERVKEHARNAGDIFANYVAFWHNCDSDLVYTMFGAAILVLVGAFVGKWGHS